VFIKCDEIAYVRADSIKAVVVWKSTSYADRDWCINLGIDGGDYYVYSRFATEKEASVDANKLNQEK
jgi:hypothetical protein